MFVPKKSKYKKVFKGRIKGNTKGGSTLSFGDYGLKAVEAGRIQSKHIETARRVISRTLKRSGKVWIRIFPDTLLVKSQQMCVWVKGKVVLNSGCLKLSPVECCLKLAVMFPCI